MDLEKELKQWREKRAREEKAPLPDRRSHNPASTAADRRSVRVNGQEVVIVKKRRKAAS